MDIEYERQYIEDCYSKQSTGESLSDAEQTYLAQYREHMPKNMNYSVEWSNKIKKELNEKYDLHMNMTPYYTEYFDPTFHYKEVQVCGLPVSN
ncbi:MAG: hypothetical protein QG610_2002 [Euryarchaeota archaeon]|nr:hypothetical protein [Euryarchaeota archaeon]MDQ1276424.1 hypothetical protein [Euryarchaeota archaeon]